MREFDLNIEKILENWEVYHAIREIVANAIDEQVLSDTEDIEITGNGTTWYIRDYGRGLNYHHLTQNENEEKLKNDRLIGKFGVGLKDALATLYRHNVVVRIESKYGIITLKESNKAGFNDIVTLHAEIAPASDKYMRGTEFCLIGCTEEDIDKALSLFLNFNDDNDILAETKYGEIIENKSGIPSIYINGVKVAEESNFLFSYNITSLTTQIKKALNRERTNVGRTAYANRIKDILISCEDEYVVKKLMHDLQNISVGTSHDEIGWSDVQLHIVEYYKKESSNGVFISSNDLQNRPEIIDEIKRDGYKPIIVSDNLVKKVNERNEVNDEDSIMTVSSYVGELANTFKPELIHMNELTDEELKVFNHIEDIFYLIGGRPKEVKYIHIAKSLYDSNYRSNAVGLWSSSDGAIYIKRSQLQSLEKFAGTLLHECSHAISGASDVSREFELSLTDMLGLIVKNILK